MKSIAILNIATYEQLGFHIPTDFDKIFKAFQNKKADSILLRFAEISAKNSHEIHQKFVAYCDKYNFNKLAYFSAELDLEQFDGIHFKSNQNIPQNLPNHLKKGKSCHSIAEIKANEAFYDYFFLSPIFPTKSHPNTKTLRIGSLIKAKEITRKPIFALGGINDETLIQLKQINHKHFAAIRHYIPK